MLSKLSNRFYSKNSTKQQAYSYKSCFDLPLFNFIEISISGNLNWLIINGNPKNLETIWAGILSEYSELSEDNSINTLFRLVRDITYLTNRLNIIELIINQLSLKRNEDLIERLREMGFRHSYEKLPEALSRIVSLVKNDKVKRKQLLKQYEDIKSNPGNGATREDWEDEITELSKYVGYRIDKKQVTVSEYLSFKKSYKQYIEHLKQQNSAKR